MLGRTEIEGVWWRSDRPNNQVAGRLVASRDDVRLSLIGTFHEPEDLFGTGEYPLVYGLGQGRLVTLQGCIDAQVNVSIPGTVLQTIAAEAAYIGAHLQRFEATRLRVSFMHRPEWTEPPSVSHERIEGAAPGALRLEYRPPDAMTATLPQGEIQLVLTSSLKPSSYDDATLERHIFFAIALPEPMALPLIHRHFLIPLENLLTFATGNANGVVSLEIWPSREAGETPSDPRPVDVIYPQVARLPEAPARLGYDRLLFHARDLATDFGGFIGRWLALSEELESVCTLLFSQVRAPAPYSETNFLIVSQAAEVLHRRLLPGFVLRGGAPQAVTGGCDLGAARASSLVATRAALQQREVLGTAHPRTHRSRWRHGRKRPRRARLCQTRRRYP
jgi:hypothetical protein